MTTDLPRSTDPLLDDAAPLLRRLAALAYDALLLFALLFVFTLAAIVLRGGREIGPGTLWFEASLVAVALLFCAGFWTRGGQTLGMRAWRIRLIAADGGPITWPRACGRFFAGWLAALPLRARLLVGAVRLTPPLLARHALRHARGARAAARV